MGLHIPSHILSLNPYVPGKPIEETQREFRLKKVVKLASNENAMGPSPKTRLALQKCLREMSRYPDANGFRLKELVSKTWKAEPDQILLGNGSNEIMDIAIRTFCVPGDVVVAGQAAFIAMKICAQIHGVTCREIPLKNWVFDLDGMADAAIAEARCRLVYLPNPNNPTGTAVDARELRVFLAKMQKARPDVLVLLDDAYWGYADEKAVEDANLLRAEFANVVLMRTFSKIFGLAGIRVGVGIGSKDAIAAMQRVRMPFNVSIPGLVGAEAALRDLAYVRRVRRVHQVEKRRWEAFFDAQGVDVLPTQGNFFLANVRTSLGLSGDEVFQRMLRRGVILRPVGNYGLHDWVRISIGLPQENRFAMQVWKKEFPQKQA
jgi:histidinol-phosphate aminotransferase